MGGEAKLVQRGTIRAPFHQKRCLRRTNRFFKGPEFLPRGEGGGESGLSTEGEYGEGIPPPRLFVCCTILQANASTVSAKASTLLRIP